MKGRKPRPAEERRQDVEDRSHRPAVQPALLGGRVDEGEDLKPPPHLSRHMRAVWTIVVDDMRAGGILDRADLGAVEAFAVAMGRAREIRAALELLARSARKRVDPDDDSDPAMLARAGLGHLLSPAARGTQANPLLGKEVAALTEARQIGEHLGLSPVGRTRLGLEAKGNVKGPRSMAGELERKLGPSPRVIQGGRSESA